MNKKELFECLSGLSKTNNLRDGIDIRKEEANIIVNEIERLNNIIKEVREYIEEKYDYILRDDIFLDHDEIIERKQIEHILEILDKVEDKKIEKVNNYVLCDYDFKNKDDDNNLIATNIIDKAFEEYSHKINEIIDKLNEMEKE